MNRTLILTMSTIAGLLGYIIYTESTVLNAVTIVFFGALLAHGLRTKAVTWSTVKLFQQPYIIGLTALALGFFYFSMRGFSFDPSAYFSIGTAMIGFAVGIVIYGLWNLR